MSNSKLRELRKKDAANARRGIRNILNTPSETTLVKKKRIKSFLGKINMNMSDVSTKR